MSELLEYASEYGFSIIPCGPDKKPLVPWKEFSERRATEEEITRWCRELQPACWAVVCGEISGIIVLDFDGEPGLQTLKRLNLRPHVQTPSGGVTFTSAILVGMFLPFAARARRVLPSFTPLAILEPTVGTFFFAEAHQRATTEFSVRSLSLSLGSHFPQT